VYSNILVPVDGSAPSVLGLQEAIKTAKNLGSRIRLVHIVNEFIFDDTWSSSTYTANVLQSLLESGKAILNQAEYEVRQQGIEPDSVLLESIGGSAADLILDQAKEWPADLIVMGTHGRRGLLRAALGSDAEQVVRGAKVPVLLIRAPSQPAAVAA
jgi:nucleotide-binding universal stress UspA family protein